MSTPCDTSYNTSRLGLTTAGPTCPVLVRAFLFPSPESRPAPALCTTTALDPTCTEPSSGSGSAPPCPLPFPEAAPPTLTRGMRRSKSSPRRFGSARRTMTPSPRLRSPPRAVPSDGSTSPSSFVSAYSTSYPRRSGYVRYIPTSCPIPSRSMSLMRFTAAGAVRSATESPASIWA